MNFLSAATTGAGIYSLSEAAKYAKMHPNTLRKWFGGESARVPLRAREIECADFKAITFVEFVETVAIRSLRVDYGVSFHKIREALRVAKGEFGVDYPFAQQQHKTILIGQDLHIFLPEDPANPVQLTGRMKRQKSFRTCIEGYMEDLDFDERGMAKIYTAYRFKDQRVVMNPKMHFGEPLLRASGYTAKTLYQAAVAEGSIARAAHLYEVPHDEVEAAYRYWNSDLGNAA